MLTISGELVDVSRSGKIDIKISDDEHICIFTYVDRHVNDIYFGDHVGKLVTLPIIYKKHYYELHPIWWKIVY